MSNKSASTELTGIGIPMKITSSSTSSLASTTTFNTGGNLPNKMSKIPVHQQDSLSTTSNLTTRLETNQELTPSVERKPIIVRLE
jgi:hypothetical protein